MIDREMDSILDGMIDAADSMVDALIAADVAAVRRLLDDDRIDLWSFPGSMELSDPTNASLQGEPWVRVADCLRTWGSVESGQDEIRELIIEHMRAADPGRYLEWWMGRSRGPGEAP